MQGGMISSFQSGRVSVWWDLDRCAVPQNVDSSHVAKNVSAMLQHAGLRGPATIDAFGDTARKRLGRKVLEGLSSTGISLNHIPNHGNKDAAILVAMLLWALDNSPPASLVLISGDGDFANALHRLRLKGYNVLLVQPDQPIESAALLGAASGVWYWESVVNGKTFIDGCPETDFGQQRWISVNDMQYGFPNDVWIDFGRFLCCDEKNQELIMKAHTRFGAARALKCFGPARIKDLSMGQIILLLNQSIQKKRWLQPCGKGWPSIVINLQFVEAFLKLTAQEQGTQETHLAQRVQATAAGSCKMAQKLETDLSYTREEVRCTLAEQRVKTWLLQLPCSSQGYGLPFLQKGLMQYANIFMDQKQLEDLISQFSEDFHLERRKKPFPDLLFQKRHASTIEAKQRVQIDLASSAGSIRQKRQNLSIAANVTPEMYDQSVGGKLGSCKGAPTCSARDIPQENLDTWMVWLVEKVGAALLCICLSLAGWFRELVKAVQNGD